MVTPGIVLATLLLFPAITSAQDASVDRQIEPEDVYVRVAVVLEDLELIRLEMGKTQERSGRVIRQTMPHRTRFTFKH